MIQSRIDWDRPRRSSIRKVALVIPNSRWFGRRHWNIHPYSLGLLMGVLGDEFEVQFLDPNLEDWSLEETRERLASLNPDVVGISNMSFEYKPNGHAIARMAKEIDPEIVTVMGGPYVTSTPEMVMEDDAVDFCILGEGEYRFQTLLRALRDGEDFARMDGIVYRANGGVRIEKLEHFIQDLDAIPFPAYDRIDYGRYTRQEETFLHFIPKTLPFAKTVGSRGCPFKCTFCDVFVQQGRQFRYRSPENILREAAWLRDEYGVREILFYDDNLVVNKPHARALFEGLGKLGMQYRSANIMVSALSEDLLGLMADTGCQQVTLAVESGSDRILSKIMQKPLKVDLARKVMARVKKVGIESVTLFILGMPDETWDEIQQTIRFAEELDADFTHFGIATPLPHTELLKEARDLDALIPEFSFDKIPWAGYSQGFIRTNEFDPIDLEILRVYEWDRINFASQAKKEKIAQMMNVDVPAIEAWRKRTREQLHRRIRSPMTERMSGTTPPVKISAYQ